MKQIVKDIYSSRKKQQKYLLYKKSKITDDYERRYKT